MRQVDTKGKKQELLGVCVLSVHIWDLKISKRYYYSHVANEQIQASWVPSPGYPNTVTLYQALQTLYF